MFRRSVLLGELALISALALMGPLSMIGCRPPASGAISSSGYKHTTYPLTLPPSSSGAALLGDDWQLDNFYLQTNSVRTRWTPKDGPDYVTTYELDYDGDGKTDSKVKTDTYALRFTHQRHDGVIFLRAFPISTNQGAKRLDVLLHRYVDQMAGSGYVVTALSEGGLEFVERRFAATILREGPARVAGLEAYAATILVKNLDQLQADPNAKGREVEIVIAHTPFRYQATKPRTSNMGTSIPGEDFPVLMIAGYSNRHGDFPAAQADFRAFLSRLTISGITGASVPYPQIAPDTPPTQVQVGVPGAAPPAPEAPEEPTPAPSAPSGPTAAPAAK
jgi:hypothetical protein